mmetsp:Transcript_15889/g.41023  ORF Transcript_15889/g.41023 Transcript_15889/m.41023 type:complete len:243 (+) Transcript_15889:1189-1917(+)
MLQLVAATMSEPASPRLLSALAKRLQASSERSFTSLCSPRWRCTKEMLCAATASSSSSSSSCASDSASSIWNMALSKSFLARCAAQVMCSTSISRRLSSMSLTMAIAVSHASRASLGCSDASSELAKISWPNTICRLSPWSCRRARPSCAAFTACCTCCLPISARDTARSEAASQPLAYSMFRKMSRASRATGSAFCGFSSSRCISAMTHSSKASNFLMPSARNLASVSFICFTASGRFRFR